MATSSVAAALALPEIVAAVDSFNELLPGVPASKENLRPMWESLRKKAFKLEEPACRIWLHIEDALLKPRSGTDRAARLRAGIDKTARLQVLVVNVSGPVEATEAVTCPRLALSLENWRVPLDAKGFDATIDGFADALAWGKDMAKRVRDEDFCERCRSDGFAADSAFEGRKGFPHKRMRARPLPICAECSMEVALGAPPAKRARRE
jgi:hypothetical protein